jgi:bacterioferritin
MKNKPAKPVQKPSSQPFLTDVQELRRRARQSIEKGSVTPSYGLPAEQAIEILQSALATEIVCVLRYKSHAVSAAGIHSADIKAEFEEHAKNEEQHLDWLAERINQLGGEPNLNPEGLTLRSHTEYGTAETLIDMIKEDLIAERIAVESYTEIIRFFGEKDITTRRLLEQILEDEEEHASDMHDLLVAQQGRPLLKK